MNVPAGKGICEEDVVSLENSSKGEKNKKIKSVKSKEVSSTSGKRQMRPKVIVTSDEDAASVMDLDENLCESTSDDDWETFRAKQIDIVEEEANEDENNIKRPTFQPVTKQEGAFVVVNYDGHFYPGVIESFDEEGAEINAKVKTAKENWKWPEKKG